MLLTFEDHRVQERIPLVTKSGYISPPQPAPRAGLRWNGLVVLAVLISTAPMAHVASGQETYYGTSTTGVESSPSWPWLHGWYYRADGTPWYGRGFANSTRYHAWRLPVTPPISGPSFGYHQPCWRQVPVVRRCVTCETLQPNREIPEMNGLPVLSPTLIPPVPDASAATLESADAEGGHSDPEAPTAAPAP